MKKRILSLVLTLAMVLSLFAGLTITASAAGEKVISFDFTQHPAGWPTASSTGTYTLAGSDGNTYSFALDGGYIGTSNAYLMVGKANKSLGLPAIEGYKLTKVVATNTSGASTNVKVSVNGIEQQWGTKSSSFTYNLTGTVANTSYALLVTNAYNAQIASLELTYAPDGDPTEPSSGSSEDTTASEPTEPTETEPPVGGDVYYEKVTAISDGNYIIVNEASSKAFNGLDAVNGYVDVTISNGKITDPNGAAIVEIAAMTGGYSLKITNGTNADKYLAGKLKSGAPDNGITFSATAVANSSITFADGFATITSDTGTTFRFNNASDQQRFRYYKTTTTGASYIVPALYKEVSDEAPCEHEHYEDREAVAATCTTSGFAAGRYCLDCNTYITGGEVTLALGHDYAVVHTTAPTCTEAGLDTYTCSRCSDSKTEPVAALGHTYENGSCTVCGAAEPEPLELEGDFYIAAIRSSGNYWYMKGELTTGNTQRFVATDTGLTELPAEISTPDAAYIWTIGQDSDDNFTLYNAAAGKYASWTSGNSGALADVALPLVITAVEGGYEFTYITGGEKDRTIALNSTSGNNYFAFYEGSQAKTLVLIPVNGEVCEHEETTLTGAVAATCTEPGYTGDLVCDNCGGIAEAGEVIPALGHIDENEDLVCDRCDADLTPVELEGYTLVTDAADLEDGDVFVFGATKDGTTYGSGGVTGTNKFLDSVEATLTDNVLSGEGLVEITLIAVDGGWNLKIGDKFINATAAKALIFADEASTVWTISIDENNLATVSAGETAGRFLYNVGSPRFLNYSTATNVSMLLPSIYKAAGDTPDVPPVEHEHNIYHYEGVAATCSDVGYAEYYTCLDTTCECYNKMYSDEALTAEFTEITIPALGHNMVAGNVILPTCTEAGHTEYACSRCPATDMDNIVPALGHDFAWNGNVGIDGYHGVECSRCPATDLVECTMVDGTCTICGYTEAPAAPIVDNNISIGKVLSLESDLSIKFRVRLNQLTNYDLSTAYLVVEKDMYPAGGTMFVREESLEGYVEGDRLVFKFAGIAACEMNDEIRATFHIFDSNGQEYISEQTVYSICTYATNTLPAANAKLKTLIIDMLNYGAAAQINFNRHADALANADFEAYQQYASAGLATPLTNDKLEIANAGSNGAVTKIGTAVSLEARVGIKMTFTMASGYTLTNDTKMVVTDEDGNVITTITAENLTLDDRGRIIGVYDGLAAREMRTVVGCTLYYGDTVASSTMKYSINSYAYYAATTAGMPANTVALTEAMVIYGDSAAAYFGG